VSRLPFAADSDPPASVEREAGGRLDHSGQDVVLAGILLDLGRIAQVAIRAGRAGSAGGSAMARISAVACIAPTACPCDLRRLNGNRRIVGTAFSHGSRT
jgi:hypothetical protein